MLNFWFYIYFRIPRGAGWKEGCVCDYWCSDQRCHGSSDSWTVVFSLEAGSSEVAKVIPPRAAGDIQSRLRNHLELSQCRRERPQC